MSERTKLVILLTIAICLAFLALSAQSEPYVKLDLNKTDSVECEKYVVKDGDWLSKIAKKYYGDAKKYGPIVAANKNLKPDSVYPEQVIYVPKSPVFGAVYSYNGQIVGNSANGTSSGSNGHSNNIASPDTVKTVKQSLIVSIRFPDSYIYSGQLGSFLSIISVMNNGDEMLMDSDSLDFRLINSSIGNLTNDGLFMPIKSGKSRVIAKYRDLEAECVVEAILIQENDSKVQPDSGEGTVLNSISKGKFSVFGGAVFSRESLIAVTGARVKLPMKSSLTIFSGLHNYNDFNFVPPQSSFDLSGSEQGIEWNHNWMSGGLLIKEKYAKFIGGLIQKEF